jgi:hypothetical protein
MDRLRAEASLKPWARIQTMDLTHNKNNLVTKIINVRSLHLQIEDVWSDYNIQKADVTDIFLETRLCLSDKDDTYVLSGFTLYRNDFQNCTKIPYRFKVPLTPKIFFRLYKSSCFRDHHCEKIFVVAVFVNFLWIFKVGKIGLFHVHDRGIAENGTSWLVTSFPEQQCFASEKNICEHAIVWVKIVVECKEDVLLEAVAIQQA